MKDEQTRSVAGPCRPRAFSRPFCGCSKRRVSNDHKLIVSRCWGGRMSLLHRLEVAPSGSSWPSPHFMDCRLVRNIPLPSKAVCFPQRRLQTPLRHAMSQLPEVGSQQAGNCLRCARGGARREKDQMDCFPPLALTDQILMEQADQ